MQYAKSRTLAASHISHVEMLIPHAQLSAHK